MSPEEEQLARRAVACKRWRWVVGMGNTDRDRVLAVRDGVPVLWASDARWTNGVPIGLIEGQHTGQEWSARYVMSVFPDLSDAATLGCLLALVREAWGASGACVVGCTLDGWRFWLGDGYREHEERHPTEAAALVAALEAAPAKVAP